MVPSQDFSTSSLRGEVAKENEEVIADEGGDLEQYQIVERKQWEQRYIHHSYCFYSLAHVLACVCSCVCMYRHVHVCICASVHACMCPT